ncbi:MAG: ph-response sensor protein [Candelina mexicana]|nr:MAG: ph-response sensor protein [Candelina mexicana]
MNSNPNLLPSTLPRTPSRTRSWITRLAQPLSSRTRTLSEFYIQPDEPHKQYSPGDVVKGKVILSVAKPIRITHLVVCLHGHVQVFQGGGRNASDKELAVGFLGPGRGKRKGEYLGNGFASLFEDEVILCGEGRLIAREYHFNYELEFPSKGLPSSIDFERGRISYTITSTLTRPTTISPTSSCDQKVSLLERIDVTPFSQPRAQLVTMEAISRKSRPKLGAKGPSMLLSKRKQNRSSGTTSPGTSDLLDAACLRNPIRPEEAPQSPVPSEIGSESTVSSCRASLQPSHLPSPTGLVGFSDTNSTTTSEGAKTITATIELLRGGCLRGDMLPFTIIINHTKPIKSLHGVILTLYRQCRLDTHPNIPLGAIGKDNAADKAKYEDYLPKSKSGLGGLSLSTTGPSSLFRKDLSQTFAPLIVDPQSLTTTIKASVRVPADAFPTISSVPGALISFKYFVEVVIDIHGKLAGQDRFLPRIGMVNLPSAYSGTVPTMGGNEDGGSMLAAWGGGVVPTEQIRREKSIIASEFEIVVGTVDNDRRRTKRGLVDQPPETPLQINSSVARELGTPLDTVEGHEQLHREMTRADAPGYGDGYNDRDLDRLGPTVVEQPQSTVPLPQIENEDDLDEKTRMRRAEERLLPSGPPVESDPSSASTIREPTAPDIEEASNAGNWYHQEFACPSTTRDSDARLGDLAEMTVSSPTGQSFMVDGNSHVRLAQPNPQPPSEDKYELERRRLQAQVSAPEYFPNDGESGGEASSARVETSIAPSAPVLSDGDYNEYHASPSTMLENSRLPQESLPRYER